MNDERAREIEAGIDHAVDIGALSFEQERNMRDLLYERERMIAVVIAAHAIVKSHDAGHEILWNERETLKAVLTSYMEG